MKPFTTFVWLTGLLAIFGGQAALAECKVNVLAQLPVTMQGLRPTIAAKIDGHDVRLLVDSGAFYSLISPGTAAELKLRLQPTRFGFTMRGVGGDTGAELTTIKTFTLDSIPLHNILFLVGGSETGNAGLIGRNVLDLADTEYDLANGVIRLMRPTGCGDRAMAYWSGGKTFSTLKIMSVADRLTPLLVEVTVNGVKLKALLDTGAAGSTIAIGAARRAGMTVSSEAVTAVGLSRGVGRRMVRSFVTTLASIKIGDEEIKNTRIQVLDTSGDDWDMLLGADFFLSHRVYVARSQRTVYFTYNGGPVFNLVAKPLDAQAAAAPTAATKAADTSTPGAAAPAAVEPTDAAGFSRRGEAYAGRRDYPAAMADLDRAVAMAPDNADYVFQRATVRLANGQVFLAMADIEQTLKLRPGDPDALMTRAELHFMGHDRNAGLADLDAVAKAAPAAADVRLRLAGLYDRWDKPAEAIAQYNLWIPAHPDDNRHAQALNGRCWARGLLGEDLEKALSDCDAAHRLMPKNASFLDSRGLAHLRLRQFDKAIADYDASLAIQPKSAWSLYGRGLAKLGAGDPAGGKADLAAATALNSRIANQAAKFGLNPPPAP
jgi:predicted aspartyl protease/tetratricopeptide (TPR) repeat protein